MRVPQNNKNKDIFQLIVGLPSRVKGLWLTTMQIHRYIIDGGGPSTISVQQLQESIRRCNQGSLLDMRPWQHTKYYLIRDPAKPAFYQYKDPSQQILDNKFVLPSISGPVLLRVPRLKNIVDGLAKSNSKSNSTSNNKENEPPPTANKQDDISFKIISEELDIQWTNRVAAHCRNCPSANLQHRTRVQNGFEIIDTYECLGCRTKLTKRASPVCKSKINERMTTDSYF